MAETRRRETSTERAPHLVGRSRLTYTARGQMVSVGCAKCGKWIFHERRHACEVTDDERVEREAWRAARVEQLRHDGVELAVEL